MELDLPAELKLQLIMTNFIISPENEKIKNRVIDEIESFHKLSKDVKLYNMQDCLTLCEVKNEQSKQ